MNRRYLTATACVFLIAAIAALGLPPRAATARTVTRLGRVVCGVDGVVTGSGLPTNEVVNFMVTDTSATTGWVLGYTWDGTFSVRVPATSAPTTYEFSAEPGP
jgi:hypothetical protein